MHGRRRRNLATVGAVAVFLAGGTLAAVAATGNSSKPKHPPARSARHLVVRTELDRAAGYLGLSTSALKVDLSAGRTLAQIADATSGKSASGLIAALVAAKRASLRARATRVPEQVRAAVNQRGGPGAPGRGDRYVARLYLGLRAAQLTGDMRSGMTLAQIANATAGKSEAGLIQALVSARSETLADALAAGRLTKAQEQARLSKLTKRVSALVNRRYARGLAKASS